MADEYIRKQWAGGAPATTLNGAVTSGATSMTISSATGQPDGSVGKFVMVIDRGLATEEKILVTSRTTTTLNTIQRGYDGTSAQAHSNGATIEHCIDAYTLDQVNAMANAATAQYDMVYRGGAGNVWSRIPIGSEGQVLAVTAGVPVWSTVGSVLIPDSTITSAKILDGTIALADLSAALQAYLVPAGMIGFTIASTAPTGWLFHNQAVANAQTLYPALWAASPATWRSGSTLNIPNLTDTVLAQTGGSAAALGATGGAMTTTIASGNLPTHTHAIDHDHASATTSSNGSHDHTLGDGQFIGTGTTGFAQLIPITGGSYVSYGVTNADGAHTHTVDLANFTGTSGNGGFANTAMTTRPLHLGCNIIIKAH